MLYRRCGRVSIIDSRLFSVAVTDIRHTLGYCISARKYIKGHYCGRTINVGREWRARARSERIHVARRFVLIDLLRRFIDSIMNGPLSEPPSTVDAIVCVWPCLRSKRPSFGVADIARRAKNFAESEIQRRMSREITPSSILDVWNVNTCPARVILSR